ncbi:PAS domain S-box protein [Halegenticoccus soli]|uniref:PAS domain S-box protein n=1 Tax=Halegenticoccus soli TaxID=1985678 RepID=UPI000C6CAABF|nr:PAS domain S-box protein [Halegenticoccus soli]
MTSSDPTITPEDVLTVLKQSDGPRTPVTASEVAAALNCSETIADDKLAILVERGALRAKEVGACERVWWRPACDPLKEIPETVQFTALTQAVTEYAIFKLDRDGRVTSWNEGAERIKGYSEAEILGAHVSSFYTDADVDAGVPETNLAKAETDGECTDEGWRVRKDGTRFWADVSITALYGDDGSVYGYVKVTRDSTERREYEQQLRRERDLRQRILEASPIGISSLTPDGEILLMNERATDIVGTVKDEQLGETYSGEEWSVYDTDGQPVPPEDRPFSRVLQTGEPVFGFELQVERPDGDRAWLSVNGMPVVDLTGEISQVILTYEDITTLKEREEQLREARDVKDQILQTSPVGIGVFACDGTVVETNRRAVDLLGFESSDFDEYAVGTLDVYDREGQFIPPEDRPVTQVFTTGEPIEERGINFESPDGTRRWLSVSVAPLTDGCGEIQHVVVAGKDITALKKRERALQRERDLIDRILDTIPVGVTIFNPDKTLERANTQAIRNLGYEDGSPTEYEIGDLDMLDEDDALVPIDDRPYVRVFEMGEPVFDEVIQYELPTGDREWLSINAAPLFTEDGELERVIVAGKNITRLKRQARQLERQRDELERELDEVFKRIDDAFFALDVEWRFTYVNDRAKELLEKPGAELLDSSIWEEFSEAVGSTFQEEYERALATQQPVSFEEYYPPLDTWFEVRVYPSETGLSVYFRDVTERKARERELEQYQRIVETIWDGVAALDADNQFVMVNEAFCAMTGYDQEELLGEHATLVHSPTVNTEAASLTESVLAGDSPFATLEFDLTAADGSTIPVEGRFGPYEYEDGTYGRAGVVRDVTDRKRREQELKAQISQQKATATLGKRALEESDLGRLMDEAVELVAETLDTDCCKVLELLPDGENLHLRAGVGWHDGVVGTTFVETDRGSQAGYTLLSAEPVVVKDLSTETRFSGPDLLTDHDVVSGISVVIGSPDDPWGVLGTHDRAHREFTDHEITFVQSVSNILATAIERADREFLLTTTQSIAEAETFEGGLEAVLDEVCDVTEWEYGEAWLPADGGPLELVSVTHANVRELDSFVSASLERRFAPGEGLAGRVWKSGEPIWITDVLDTPGSEFARGEEARPVGLRTALGVPIVTENGVVGVLNFFMTEARGSDSWLINSVSAIATKLGDIIARRQAERALEREKELLEQILEMSPVAITVLTAEGEFVRLNSSAESIFGLSEEEIVGQKHLFSEWLIYDENDRLIPRRDRPFARIVETREPVLNWEAKLERSDGTHIWLSVNGAPLVGSDGTVTHVVFATEDVTDEKRRELDLQRQVESLKPLNRYNTITQEITETIATAQTTNGVEEATCQAIASFDPYTFAVTGEFSPDYEEFLPRAWAGIEQGELEAVLTTDPGKDLVSGLGAMAARTGTVQVLQSTSGALESRSQVGEDPQWAYQSVIFVPLAYNDVVHGVLGVFTASPFAFSEDEAALLEELGRTVGLALVTVKNKQLLSTDVVTEISFCVTDSDLFFLSASEATGCSLTLNFLTPAEEGTYVVYIAVEGTSPEQIAGLASESPEVVGARVLRDSPTKTGGKLEVTLSSSSPLMRLFDFGAQLHQATVDDGVGQFVITVPSGESTRSTLRWIKNLFSTVEFVSKRDVSRIQNEQYLSLNSLEGSLTGRQQDALETAYQAGYFEWPRESTAEEVADAMGITPPTFHHHLRKAERELVTAFLTATSE